LLEKYQLFPELPPSQRIQRTERAIEFAPTTSRNRFAIEVGFECGNPRLAQEVARDLAGQLLMSNYTYNRQHFPQIRFCLPSAVCDYSGFELLDVPRIPQSPAWPNVLAVFSLGCCLGLVAGTVSWLWDSRRA
jgi:hypothetical protein